MSNYLSCMLSAGTMPAILHRFKDMIDGTLSEGNVDSEHFADDSEPSVEADERRVSLLPVHIYRALLRCVQADGTIHHGTEYRTPYDHTAAGDDIVLNAQAEPLLNVRHRGKRFATVSHCETDSHVIFRASNGEGLVLGRIEQLFVHKRRCGTDRKFHHQVFAVVRRYLGLTAADAERDPYRRYSGLRASLVYESLSRENEVITVRNITAHFVTCPYPDEGALSSPCLVALPLDQVCTPILRECPSDQMFADVAACHMRVDSVPNQSCEKLLVTRDRSHSGIATLHS